MMMTDPRFRYGMHTGVEGLDLIFKVLVLIAKMQIYQMPIRDMSERDAVNDFIDELRELIEE